MTAPLRVATRGSRLARTQATAVASRIEGPVELVIVSTQGDRRLDVPIHDIGGTGVFTKEVQDAVLDGRADLTVHSAKDLPSVTPPGLVLAAVPERADPRDALVGCRLDDLPTGALIGTGAVRRRAQLAGLRPDLCFAELRGNIDTRLVRAVGFDAIVMAHQVHGARVLVHGAPASGWVLHDGADGHTTPHAGLLLGVTVADCTPVYLHDPVTGLLALLHAGWRGAAGGIVDHALELWRTQYGVRMADVVMHCGVSISGPAYEVGGEVFAACRLPEPMGGKGRLDVRAVLVAQAHSAGVGEVSVSPWCTSRDAGHFHSHRRSLGADGRMLAYIGRPARVLSDHPAN